MLNPWCVHVVCYCSCKLWIQGKGIQEPQSPFRNYLDGFSIHAEEKYGHMSTWDTSRVTDMSNLFKPSDYSLYPVQTLGGFPPDGTGYGYNAWINFNEQIGNWDTSGVTTMENLFGDGDRDGSAFAVAFTASLTNWDVSRVRSMKNAFKVTPYTNTDFSRWDVQNVEDMSEMFADPRETSWGQPNPDLDPPPAPRGLSNWNTAKVTDMSGMFKGQRNFDENLSSWNVARVTDMSNMFNGATSFDSDVSNWRVSSVINMNSMFRGAEMFDGDLSDWETFNVENMGSMFEGATNFNGDISTWSTSSVVGEDTGTFAGVGGGMISMFKNAASFNRNLNNWDVSNVLFMTSMFEDAEEFNGDLSNWNPEDVYRFNNMFKNARRFNQDISGWTIVGSPLTDDLCTTASMGEGSQKACVQMGGMFEGASDFDQDLSQWDMSFVTDADGMFQDASSFAGQVCLPFGVLEDCTGGCNLPDINNDYFRGSSGSFKTGCICEPGTYLNLGETDGAQCLSCNNPDACLGDNVCSTGVSGVTCSTCADGWFYLNSACYECPAGAQPLFWTLSSGLAAALCVIVYRLSGENVDLAQWGKASIAVTHFQLSALHFRFNLEIPDAVQQVVEALFSIFGFAFADVLSPECSTGSLSYRNRWGLRVGLPLIAPFVCTILGYVAKGVRCCGSKTNLMTDEHKEKIDRINGKLTRGYFMFTSVMFVSSMYAILEIFDFADDGSLAADPYIQGPNGQIYQVCDEYSGGKLSTSTRFIQWIFLAVCAGFLFIYYGVIWHRAIWKHPENNPLLKPYKDDMVIVRGKEFPVSCVHFSLTSLNKTLTIIASLFVDQGLGQAGMTFAFTTCYLAWHVHAKPYVKPDDNKFETTLIALQLTQLFMLMVTENAAPAVASFFLCTIIFPSMVYIGWNMAQVKFPEKTKYVEARVIKKTEEYADKFPKTKQKLAPYVAKLARNPELEEQLLNPEEEKPVAMDV